MRSPRPVICSRTCGKKQGGIKENGNENEVHLGINYNSTLAFVAPWPYAGLPHRWRWLHGRDLLLGQVLRRDAQPVALAGDGAPAIYLSPYHVVDAEVVAKSIFVLQQALYGTL